MLLDAGIVEICRISEDATCAGMPKEALVPFMRCYYGERTVGYNRQYAAKGVSEQVDALIRIWQDRSVRIGMYAITDDGTQYRIDNVQHLPDNDGLLVTDLTLRRLDDLYDVARKD